MPVSQVSPGSTTPLPQVAEQSGSVAFVAPDGQQPSPGPIFGDRLVRAGGGAGAARRGVRRAGDAVVAARRAGRRPDRRRAMAVSQVSPGSTRPLPQRGLGARAGVRGGRRPASGGAGGPPQLSDTIDGRASAGDDRRVPLVPGGDGRAGQASSALTSMLTFPVARAGSSALSVVGKAIAWPSGACSSGRRRAGGAADRDVERGDGGRRCRRRSRPPASSRRRRWRQAAAESASAASAADGASRGIVTVKRTSCRRDRWRGVDALGAPGQRRRGHAGRQRHAERGPEPPAAPERRGSLPRARPWRRRRRPGRRRRGDRGAGAQALELGDGSSAARAIGSRRRRRPGSARSRRAPARWRRAGGRHSAMWNRNRGSARSS